VSAGAGGIDRAVDGYGPETLANLRREVVGRSREAELVVAALMAGRHLLLEGPPGTGKSTLLRAISDASHREMDFVEGNAELTPARLAGHFDPAQVMDAGYSESVWVDGPLLRALRDGRILYLEEINRVPEETLNLLVTVMSEGELTVPRLGRIEAAPGFRFVAAMNPFDAVGTARISGAIYDRVCRVAMGYQTAGEEADIAARTSQLPPEHIARVVEVVRATRDHPEVRVGSSVRGAVDLLLLAEDLATLRELPPTDFQVGLDSALAEISGRIRLNDSTNTSPEEVVTQLWNDIMGPPPDQAEAGENGERSGKAPSRPAAIPTTTTGS
jgi:MoxR-like ATPase